MTFISGAHFVINRAWALLHKLDQSELLTGTQLRHPDDSVEGQLWKRKQGYADTKVKCPHTQALNPKHNHQSPITCLPT